MWQDYLNPLNWFGAATPLPKTVDAPTQETVESPPGEATGNQQTALSLSASLGYWFDFLGFGRPWAPCFATWRLVLTNPTLALVRRIVIAGILAGSWTVDADEDAPLKWKELVERSFLKHRVALLSYGLTALDFQCAPFEVVFAVDDGYLSIERFKPLSRVLTTILVDPQGRFAGLEQAATRGATASDKADNNGRVELMGPKAWLFVNEPDPDHPFGQSRLRHVLNEVWRWNHTQERIDRLCNKESGSVVDVSYPPGSSKAGDGSTVDNRTLADQHGANVAAGRAAMSHENALGVLTADQRRAAKPELLAELLKLPLWETKNVEIGGNAEAIDALEKRIAALDAKISRGYYRPERSSQEGQHGTKAEAGIHSDTGTLDSETVEADFVGQLNEGAVNNLLRLNFGKQAVGKVRVVANPLRDVQEQIDQMILEKVASNPTTADEFYRTYDMHAIAERRGIPKRQTPLPPTTPKALAEPAPVNGDGAKVNGNSSRMLMSRLFGEDGE